MFHLGRWCYGWYMWARAIRMVRTKRHGSGAQPWRYTLKMAGHARYLVDGQYRRRTLRRWIRRRIVLASPTCPLWRDDIRARCKVFRLYSRWVITDEEYYYHVMRK